MKKVFAVVLAVFLMISAVLGCSNAGKDTPSAGRQTKAADVADKNVPVQRENSGEAPKGQQSRDTGSAAASKVRVEKGKAYTDKEHVAAYIHEYKTLPPNYITKNQAAKLGWKTQGPLDKVAPGKSIGGDRFGNYEKQLPDKQGRTWKECDIDYVKGNRNAKRICYSNDGLIYYSGSHYRDFVRMY